MERDEILPDELEALPATKSPHEFTGSGLEIIGEPSKISGELWYQDGRCFSVSSASPAFEDLPPSKRPKISDGRLALWFNLERKFKLAHPPADADAATTEREELKDADRATRLAAAFADKMLKGELMSLIREVEEEYSRTAKRPQARREHNMPKDGIRDALSVIARRSTHPDKVTVSAIVDFLKTEEKFCESYQINPSMRSPREVRKRLQLIGFGWIGKGRERGRPSDKL